MPLYYFNVRCQQYETTDIVGERCKDPLEARFKAKAKARDIISEGLSRGELPISAYIDVEDESCSPVFQIAVRGASI
jgi:hypothetical protein